jgi:hypothetical protein
VWHTSIALACSPVLATEEGMINPNFADEETGSKS